MPHLQPPPDLAQWSVHCFCLKARKNPKRVIELDNNGEILFMSIGGTTTTDIRREGTQLNESQLVLLETFGLLERDGDRVTTRIPALGPDAIPVVRTGASSVAREALRGVTEAGRDIVDILNSRNLADSARAIIFGHALDGLLWSLLRARGSLPEIEPTVDEPFWRGALWAVYPGREGSAGTNELAAGNTTLVMVWDDQSVESLRGLELHPETRRLLKALPPNADRVSLASILGEPIVAPIITPDDVIHHISLDMASTVAQTMPEAEGCQSLLADAGIHSSPEEATVIVAHEVIWEVAALLEATGVVDVPARPGPGRCVFVRIDS